jgi:methionyl-tRNA synthetase
MLDQLCVPQESRTFACISADYAVLPGTRLPPPCGIFPRYVDREETGTGG